MNRVSRALLLPLVAAAVLGASACTTSAKSCSGSHCTVSLSGEQTVEFEFGRFERDLRVGPIEAAAVTVAARGEQARLTPGQTATVGGLAVQLTKVSGKDVGLTVSRA